jgi:predicted AlkP superfamily pyrophosphatase or phosphodiesterase
MTPTRSLPIFISLLSLAIVIGCQSTAAQKQLATTRPTIQPTTRPLSGLYVLPTTRPANPIHRLLIVSIDGLRPDVMLRANAPNLRSLMKEGSYTCWARTTNVAITLPSHVSMLTGVTPDRHGIYWNNDPLDKRDVHPNAPSILQLAHDAGLTTGMVSGKSKFKTLYEPAAVDWALISETDKCRDGLVAEWADRMIQEYAPQVMFLHFPGADDAGHSKGWGTPDQVSAIERIDASFGIVLQALKDKKLYDQTAIIVSADHGGSGTGHGAQDERSRYIPWIARGPGIRKNYDLTRYKDLYVNTEDTFATACMLLGLPYDSAIDGKPIHEALVKTELLKDAQPAQAASK